MIDVDLIFSNCLNSQSSLTAIFAHRIWRVTTKTNYKVSDGPCLIFGFDDISSEELNYKGGVLNCNLTLRAYAADPSTLRQIHGLLMDIFCGETLKVGNNYICHAELSSGQILLEPDSENWTMLVFLNAIFL